MKKIGCLIFILFTGSKIKSQLSGVLNVPSTYTSVASIISAVNQQGISGALTINIAANYTEISPAGGYSLTASGSAIRPVIFRKSGAGTNPLLIAYSGGSGTPGSMHQDGIFRLIGCDYITIDGIDLLDQNTSNPSTMEFGYGLFKLSANDGCQNNTIKNCVITLNRINNSGGTGPASDGSRGIDVVNALSNVHNSGLSVSSSSGSNSGNNFYSNIIQNCNIGISLIGFADISPFSFADTGNDVGGNSASTGNNFVDFGGGGSSNACAGIKTLAQYDLNISFNRINSNSGSGINHPVIIRGIYLNAATGANAGICNNTITLHGGGTSSQLSVIENAAGSTASSNTISISNNLVVNCTNTNATSGSFYGIWNTAAPENLNIVNNIFLNNSSSAVSGSTYLIYNNGAVSSAVNIYNNTLGFIYNGSAPYTGTMYSIYNANGTAASNVVIQNNNFSNYHHTNYPGSGSVYFINNTNDSYSLSINNNSWTDLILNHSGAEYFINNSSSTQSVLSVSNNSIIGSFRRAAACGAMYLYYATGSSPANCIQTITANNFSNITSTVAGTGVFYGIYNADGLASPYPKKIISNNIISNINSNSTGTFYGYFLEDLGDGNINISSRVFNNSLSAVTRAGIIYGMYISGTVSPVYAPQVYSNTLDNLNSTGPSSNLYAAYLTGGGVGLHFFKNKICDIAQTGTLGLAHGVYIASAVNTTLSNNYVGNINAPNSSATNAVNGIYINGGTLLHLFYNTVYLRALSSGGNFNSNALYCATATSLELRNSILVNLSTGGTGIASAYRRSSTALASYLPSSSNNLFYAGVPSPSNVIVQSGTTSYQTLASFQTAVNPRDAASVSQNPTFLNTQASSQNFLHMAPNVASLVESGATPVSSIPEDYDNQIRQGNPGYAGSGTSPDIGADEYNQDLTPCAVANAGTVGPASCSLCSGQSVSLTSSGYTSGTGLTHQWKVSANAGGPYNTVISGSGSLTPEFISGSLNSGTYYFVMETTCTNVPVSATSTEATVTVQQLPLASANANASLVCSGQALHLLGIGSTGSSYQWLGPNGFNSTAQNPTLSTVNLNASGNYYLGVFVNGCASPQSSVSIAVSEVTLAVSASSTVLCMGNSATLTLNSNATTYTWNNGAVTNSIIASPTVTSVYNVVATNPANCTLTKSTTLSVINPSISAGNTVACGNSTLAILSVNAFTPSIVNWYSSANSSSVLATGINFTTGVFTSTTYYAEAMNTGAGCQSMRIPVTLTVSSIPTLSLSAAPASVCPGKQSTLTVTGANTYSWTGVGSGSMHVVSPTASRIYTVTGKNTFSCSSSQTLLVSTYTLAIISVVQTATSVCPSGLVSFTASGANSYYWNTGANGSTTTISPAVNTTYTAYGINSQSCTSASTVAVITRSVPVITILQSTTGLCPGELITFTASGAISYTWLPGNNVSHTYSANPFTSSVYNAIGKSANTCTGVAIENVSVDPCVGLEKNSFENTLQIFPNPSMGLILFSSHSTDRKSLKIYSASALLVFETFSSDQNITIDLSGFPRGIYYLEIKSENSLVHRKIILDGLQFL